MSNELPGRGMRADARRNRDRIVACARELIAERGAEVPTEEVARRAAVGVGTVYRHFPDRSALVRAVALDSFHRAVEIARAAEDEEADAWCALSRFLQRAAGELRLATWLSIWFASTWSALRDDPEDQQLRRQFGAILDRLVRRAQADGHLRDDVDVADVAYAVAGLLRPIPGVPKESAQWTADRNLVLLLDGLRADSENSALPPRGVTPRPFPGPEA